MSNAPPTLADACIAAALHKKIGARPAVRNLLLTVANARKFVLDDTMSKYLADISHSFWSGGLRKRNHALDNARQMARLPHATTWIEFNYATGYFLRAKEIGSLHVMDKNGNEPAKFGWLVRQHPQIETAFIASLMRTSMTWGGLAFTHPVSVQWRSDDGPLMWPTMQVFEGEASEYVVAMEGYVSSHVAWAPTFGMELSEEMLHTMVPPGSPDEEVAAYVMLRIPARDLWAFLATINDLPVRIETVEPSRGYLARGSYKKFLKHSIVHLTVPETQFRRLVTKSAIMLRKRAHQVRGHWRKDWRHPLSPLCEHVFDEMLSCRNCRGRQVWVHEHQRGDTSLGFVTHDYVVKHEVKP